MGTSRKLPGPPGGEWRTANQRLGLWVSRLERSNSGPDARRCSPDDTQKDEKFAQDIATLYLAALARTLQDDPAAFGLREKMVNAGNRLVDILDALRASEADWSPPLGDDAEDRAADFLQRFVETVAGTDCLITDAAIRESAATCGEELLSAPGSLRDAVQDGKAVSGPAISSELFCLVFRIFFKDAVTGFITTIIAEKVKLAVPVLHVIDPAGKIADWVAEQVVARIPDPCAEGEALGEKPSLAELAQGLVAESVDRAVGIVPSDSAGVAA